jgi:anti-sigma regulatory factor (Ser/Thr protein kinase)
VFPEVQAARTQARRERKPMTVTATESTSLIAFTLPSTPYSVRIARFYVRATLNYHDLDDFGADAETVTAELVTNAITHAGTPNFGVELMRLQGSGTLAVAVVVTDSSPLPPVLRDAQDDAEHGRGLQMVAALSAGWSWTPDDIGKAVFAILMHKGQPVEAISDQRILSGVDADYSTWPHHGGKALARPGKGNRRP